MRKLMPRLLLTVGLALSASVICSAQQIGSSTATSSSASAQNDSELLKLLEVTKIRLDAAEQKAKLLEDRIAAKDSTIVAKDETISLLNERLTLAKATRADLTAISTGDARMLASCEQQLAKADAEIHRLRFPGFFRSVFDFRSITGVAVGYGIGRVSK